MARQRDPRDEVIKQSMLDHDTHVATCPFCQDDRVELTRLRMMEQMINEKKLNKVK